MVYWTITRCNSFDEFFVNFISLFIGFSIYTISYFCEILGRPRWLIKNFGYGFRGTALVISYIPVSLFFGINHGSKSSISKWQYTGSSYLLWFQMSSINFPLQPTSFGLQEMCTEPQFSHIQQFVDLDFGRERGRDRTDSSRSSVLVGIRYPLWS